MPTKPGLIARIFGRSQNSVVAKLYSHGINTPLLVHPAIGERLLGAYLEGAVDSRESAAASAGTVAVINISGAMVNRPMPDMCGMGPISYTEIRCAIDEALADGNVSAVVLRLDTPGGMCSGCFDLCDWIYANNKKNGGSKPIIAQVDDMAYSAGYALASACDEIWMTRTGGVGSIGVVCYHVDQSAYDAKIGVKVTYIYAGQHKVDGNAHEPLADSVKNAWQVEVDLLRELFVGSVARYRGMDPQAVSDTEANCYTGQAGIDIGFADYLGTLEDLLTNLTTPAEPESPDQETQDMPDESTPAATATTLTVEVDTSQVEGLAAAAAKGALATALADSTLSADIVKAMLKMDIPADQIAAKLEHASKVADLCKAAKLESCAPGLITRGVSIDQVRTELQGAVAAPDAEIVTALPTQAAAGAKNSRQEVYSRRRDAAAGTGSARGKR